MSYIERTSGSINLYERAKKVLPGGVTYSLRAVAPHPFYVKHAEGVKLWDVDGNIYTDYWAGHGALLLGHSPKPVVEEVKKQIVQGTHYGFCHELEIQLAERIVDMVPSAELVRYTNSGTEGNLYATRLARSYTKRTKMVKIIGGWHGGYDSLHLAVHAPFNTAESAGLNPKVIEDTVTISFNDIEAAEKALRTEDKACIIIEPILGAAGFIPAEKEYLKALREICDDTGTILIFDEVITGFRVSPGGAQEYYKVIPDLTVMGKVLGGGFGIGAFTGRKEIFELIDHEKYPKMEERSAHGGTFTGNPISMTAGITTLDIIKDGKVHGYVNALGSKVRQGIREIIDDHNTPASITGVGSCFALHFRETPPVNAEEAALADSEKSKLYFSHMLEKNIAYMSPTLVHAFLCEPHTTQDVDDFLSATETFFKHHDI